MHRLWGELKISSSHHRTGEYLSPVLSDVCGLFKEAAWPWDRRASFCQHSPLVPCCRTNGLSHSPINGKLLFPRPLAPLSRGTEGPPSATIKTEDRLAPGAGRMGSHPPKQDCLFHAPPLHTGCLLRDRWAFHLCEGHNAGLCGWMYPRSQSISL